MMQLYNFLYFNFSYILFYIFFIILILINVVFILSILLSILDYTNYQRRIRPHKKFIRYWMNNLTNNDFAIKRYIYLTISPFINKKHQTIKRLHYLKNIAQKQTIKYILLFMGTLLISIFSYLSFYSYISYPNIVSHNPIYNPETIQNNDRYEITSINKDLYTKIVKVQDNVEQAEYTYEYIKSSNKLINSNRTIIIPDIIKNIGIIVLIIFSIFLKYIIKIIM